MTTKFEVEIGLAPELIERDQTLFKALNRYDVRGLRGRIDAPKQLFEILKNVYPNMNMATLNVYIWVMGKGKEIMPDVINLVIDRPE